MYITIAGGLIKNAIIALISTGFTTFINKELRLKQQIRLGKNLNRPIAFISNGVALKNDEIKLIKDSGLFKDVEEFKDSKNFTFDKKYGLLIYVFNESHNNDAKNIVNLARNNNTPIILYTNGVFLTPDKKASVECITSYPKHHMTQHTLNLLSAVFTTLSTYNHGK